MRAAFLQPDLRRNATRCGLIITDGVENFKCFFCKTAKNRHLILADADFYLLFYLTYSITTRRLGSTPVEWVVMFSMSCRAAWITWRS